MYKYDLNSSLLVVNYYLLYILIKMKLTLVVAALVSAAVVQADSYHFKFESSRWAKNCLLDDYDYIVKVSHKYRLVKTDLYMDIKTKCDTAIEDNLNTICGGIVSSECTATD
jgi:hypothetical protein